MKRGRYLVEAFNCPLCHSPVDSERHVLKGMKLAGGMRLTNEHGTFVSRNLTPDKETGLGRRNDDEVKRALRCGVFPDGHVTPYATMPWTSFSHLSDEDRHAIVVFLRHLKPVHHVTPEPGPPLPRGDATEAVWAGEDYGGKGK